MRLATLAALVLIARVAAACPVCFDSSNLNVLHFYSISTLFLSFLPFALVGGLALAAWHLKRQALAGPVVEEPDVLDIGVEPVPGR